MRHSWRYVAALCGPRSVATAWAASRDRLPFADPADGDTRGVVVRVLLHNLAKRHLAGQVEDQHGAGVVGPGPGEHEGALRGERLQALSMGWPGLEPAGVIVEVQFHYVHLVSELVDAAG